MAEFHSTTQPFISELFTQLLNQYDRFMLLNIFVDDDNELKNVYINAAHAHNKKILNNIQNVDAGFDLFAPGNGNPNDDTISFYGADNGANMSPVNKLDFKIICSAQMHLDTGRTFNTGYYMHPRSSLSKTQLRLANSTGIIDSGYRGHLMAMFDVVNIPYNTKVRTDGDYHGKKHDRYIQICAPGLVPIVVNIVNSVEVLGQTQRADGGFGSTGR